MNRIRIALLSLSLAAAPLTAGVADLSDLALPANSYLDNASFVSSQVNFANQNWGGYWAGFAYSNQVNTTTPGYGRQYSSSAGGGAAEGGSTIAGDIFAVGYRDYFNNVLPTLTLPTDARPVSVRLTNTTYTGLSMRDGDDFAKKFGGVSGTDPDYLKVTLAGFNALGQPTGTPIDFYLADFRSADPAQDYIVSDWRLVDLTPLGADARSVQFEFASSDTGMFGINTPTYIAVDRVEYAFVPEPASLGLVAGSLLLLARRRR